MIRFLVGVVLGMVLVLGSAWAWLQFGHPPVAVADSPMPFERQIAHGILESRIQREMPSTAPIEANEENLVAGAKIYRAQCAACHGVHGKPSNFGPNMFPDAPSLWEKHAGGKVVGVSDDPPGETWWKVANGIRLTGMPAYNKVLSDTEIWQVSLLLANADKPLPPAAVALLKDIPPFPDDAAGAVVVSAEKAEKTDRGK